MSKLRALLQLLRPANIITAHADILAGAAFALGSTAAGVLSANEGGVNWKILFLLISTTGLYGGGITLNDFFDADLDARERPERPIPSGRVSRRGAGLWGFAWLSGGIAAAFAASLYSGGTAIVVAALAILYNSAGKHHSFFGPLNMGLCRAGNLLLGVSIVPAALPGLAWVGVIPVVYIGIITFISRAEVGGGQRNEAVTAAVLMGLFTCVLGVGGLLLFEPKTLMLLLIVPFWLLFAWRVLPPFVRAARYPAPQNIGGAVRAGVLSLIILNSVLAAAAAGPVMGLLVLALWPVSMLLARIFAVT